MRKIYKDYDTNSVFLNKPCFIEGCGFIYPISVEDFIGFTEKYASYLIYDEYFLDNTFENIGETYLEKIILFNMMMKSQPDEFGQQEMDEITAIETTIRDLESILSIVTKKDVKYVENEDVFTDEKRTLIIDKNSYKTVRKVVVMQNLIEEATYYEDQEYAQLIAEARHRANKYSTEFVELIALVKNYTRRTYEEILKENVFQLYCDYSSINNIEDYRTIMNFRIMDSSIECHGMAMPFIDNFYVKDDDRKYIKEVDLDNFFD